MGETGERLVRSLEAQGRKASTLAAYESTLGAHLIPFFGDQAVTKITTEDVEGFVAACQAKGCAPKSIRNYVGTLHAIFDFARVRAQVRATQSNSPRLRTPKSG